MYMPSQGGLNQVLNYHMDYSVIQSQKISSNFQVRGLPVRSSGGAGVIVADNIFFSTRFGGALKILHFITCLYETELEINYIFHAESARNYLF